MLATVTLLKVGFNTIKIQLFKEMFYIAKFIVLSTLMFKHFFGKN